MEFVEQERVDAMRVVYSTKTSIKFIKERQLLNSESDSRKIERKCTSEERVVGKEEKK